MPYEPTKLKEKEIPEAGQRLNAVIVSIDDGKVKDFVKQEYLDQWKDKNAPCIQVTAENKKDDIKVAEIFTYSESGEVSPRSKLGAYKELHGKYPEVGDKIRLIADVKGYFRMTSG